eukprot:7133961-Prymnesium_polylepis.2
MGLAVGHAGGAVGLGACQRVHLQAVRPSARPRHHRLAAVPIGGCNALVVGSRQVHAYGFTWHNAAGSLAAPALLWGLIRDERCVLHTSTTSRRPPASCSTMNAPHLHGPP